MTDNRTTELLCKLLEERGIEFEVFDVLTEKAVTWSGNVCHWVAVTDDLGLAVAVYKDYLTPEQAIAATLGEVCEGCYLICDGKKLPVELDCGFTGLLPMPVAITVSGFRYSLEVPE